MKIKKFMIWFLIICLLIPYTSFVAIANEQQIETIEYIVKYDSTAAASTPMMYSDNVKSTETVNRDIETIIEKELSTATEVSVIDSVVDQGNSGLQLISVKTTDGDETLNELNSVDGIVFAEPNYRIKKCDIDPYVDDQWGMVSANGVNVELAWDVTKGKEDIVVAVIDSGIDITHPELSSNIFINSREEADGIDNDNNGYIDDINGWDFSTYETASNNGDNSVYDGTIIDDENVDSHGTHVAGIIAASQNGVGTQGVAPNIKILPVKFINEDDGTVFKAIKAIEYAEKMGAKIANCSWCTDKYSHFLYDAIISSSMLFVCAAGNYGEDVLEYPEYPAMYGVDNVISVAATNRDGELTSFSNYGQGVDVAAPGEEIYSTLPENTYGYLDGTSMATPFVSGSAALILSIADDLTPFQLKEMIKSTVSERIGLKEKVNSEGIIDAGKLVMSSIHPTELTSERYGAESLVYDSDMYIAGGFNEGQYLNGVERYVPETQTWERVSEMPIPVADFAITAKDNKIYFVGGYNGKPIANVQIYDIANDSWQTGKSIPEPLYGCAYTMSQNKLYLFGGIGKIGYEDTIYEYDIILDSWDKKENLPINMAYSSAVDVDGAIYLMGGCNENNCLNTIYMYDSEEDNIVSRSRMSESKKDFSTVCVDGKIYMIGGSKTYNAQGNNILLEYSRSKHLYSEALTDTVDIYDIRTNICNISDNIPEAIAGASAVYFFNHIYLIGGWSGVAEKQTVIYDGVDFPQNIKLISKGNTLTIKWGNIIGAEGYNVEVDGNVYYTDTSSYSLEVDESVEHKIRVQTVKQKTTSLWSDYIYHFLNSTITDAKVIESNSISSDRLYKTGQTRWYKLNNSEAGSITISMTDIPADCTYVVQLCTPSGEIIATGENVSESIMIENVVLSPYAYYVKVFSVYGGDSVNAYELNCSFTSASNTDIPERVKTAFLRPSSFDGQSFEDIDTKDISEYEDEVPPNEISEHEITRLSPGKGNSQGGTQSYQETVLSNILESDAEASLLSISSDSVITGQFTNEGNTYKGSVTVPKYTPTSSQRCKVVITVVPECEEDEMSIEWYGTNTQYENFWWHYTTVDGNYVYFLTAILERTSAKMTYEYKVKYEYMSEDSEGKYTITSYILVDSDDAEDYNNNVCGNDSPQYATRVNPGLGSFETITGKIDHPYDRDFYWVTATKSQKVSAYLQSPNGKKYYVAILDNRCDDNEWDSDEHMDGWVDDEFSYATITGDTLGAKKYCICVDSFDQSFSADETYTLTVYKYSLYDIGDLEANDSFTDADAFKTTFKNNYLGTTTKLATPIEFSIDSPIDVDQFAIDLNEGDKVSIKMKMPSSYNDVVERYRIEIYSNVREDDDSVIYTVNSFNNPNSNHTKFVTFVAEETGTYYIGVKSLSRSFDYDKYGTLIITKTEASSMDNFEDRGLKNSNDFIKVSLSILGIEIGLKTASPIEQSIINATIDNELDIDWYRFVNEDINKSAEIQVVGNANIETIVLDSEYNLLSAGADGNTYNFAPNETYYISAFVDDENYEAIMNDNSYTLSIELGEPRSDLIFKPLEWGTFIYDNSPEYLTEDDLADYCLGNVFLISAENLTGVIDIQSSHSIKPYMLTKGNISFDILLYNPTDKTITVDLLQYGAQAPYEETDHTSNATSAQWAALKAWSDYLQIDFVKGKDQYDGVLQYYDDFEEVNKGLEYEDYYYKNRINSLDSKGHYEIGAGQAVWLLGDSRLTITNSEKWSPMNLVARIKTTGKVTVSLAAFRDVNNVYSPLSPELIYDADTQRTYPEGVSASEKEPDLDGKSKGVATSVAEVEVHTHWIIDDSTTYFKPTVYNMANPDGYTIADGYNEKFWVTNFNTNQDAYNYNNGVESDMIPLVFEDSNKEWYFDTRHYTPLNGNGILSGSPPISTALIMGNYGVTTRYIIDIKNITPGNKTIKYELGTISHAIIRYRLESNSKWNTVVKCLTPRDDPEKMNSIFEIEISENTDETLIFEVILPNGDNGGFRNRLSVN